MHERDLASGLTDAPWPPVYPEDAGRTAARRAESRQEGREESRAAKKKASES